MLRTNRGPVVVVVALLALAACKKDDGGALPSDLRPPKAAVDVDKLAVPALFAHIPADSPYVMAAFEAIPLDYYEKMKQAFGPMVKQSIDMLRALDHGGSGPMRWVDALSEELAGKWNAKGLESLGFSATPRFAVYGHGLLPIVARIELKDHAAVLATVERVATRAGATVPPRETRHGREFWRIPLEDDSGAIVALLDNQLVVAWGPRASIADALPMILGAEKPARNMADGAELKRLITKHGLGAQMVGYLDTKRFAAGALALGDHKPPAACTDELDRLAGLVPRLVTGYSEVTAKRVAMTMVLELAPAIVDELKEMRTAVPGLGAAMSGEPLFAMGGGLDLARAKTAGKAMASTMRALGEACESEKMVRGANKLRRALSEPLPDPIAKLEGGVLSIDSIELPAGFGRRGPPIPDKLEAFAMLTASDAKAAFAAIAAEVPVSQLGVEPDGKLHRVKLGRRGMPFDVHAGVGERTLVAGAGSYGKQLAERALSFGGGGKAPFLVMALDYGKVFGMMSKLQPKGMSGGMDDDLADLNAANMDAMAKLFGRAGFTVDATDHGLAVWGWMEMK